MRDEKGCPHLWVNYGYTGMPDVRCKFCWAEYEKEKDDGQAT